MGMGEPVAKVWCDFFYGPVLIPLLPPPGVKADVYAVSSQWWSEA